MEIINSLIDVFGIAPTDIVTFTDFIIWFSKMFLGVQIISITIKAMFKATWKIERSMR